MSEQPTGEVKALAEIIDDAMDTSVRAHGQIPNWHWDGPLNAADAILAAGWRRSTVTPEQVERALRKLDTVSGILNSLATDAANGLRELDNIRAGLSVAEDGGQ